MHQTSTPLNSVEFNPFGSGAVLHQQGTHHLWLLNNSAATLWCLLVGNRDKHQVTLEYGQRFNLDPDHALEDVEAILQDFTTNGLLNATGASIAKTETLLSSVDAYEKPSLEYCTAGTIGGLH